MNRFLSKKSAAAESGAQSGPKESRKWKKTGGKKTQEEPKQDFDLSLALPSTDDFRTSLIMPNLSARFSMLREQDDPSSKLGKASDDSVLSPRRKSKPLDFSFALTNNLGDIAEDQSIMSRTQRPGLAHYDSFASDNSSSVTGTDAGTGSIMNRARPIEDGSNLFSQKHYEVAASASTRNLRRALYDDDISTSTFQRYKQIEEKPTTQDSHDGDETSDSGSLPFGLASSAAEMSIKSPPREQEPIQWSSPAESKRQPSATSSNASDNGMDTISTPATSLASQQLYSPLKTQAAPKPIMSSLTSTTSLERSATKRRLYEQGLDQNMQDQQASALTRLNTIQRQRTISGNKSPNLGASQPSGSFSHERPAQVLTTFDSINRGQSPLSSPTGSHPQSPTFFTSNEYDQNNILSSTVKPSDRGKATAMGAFHMPHQPYDEEQYIRRLQQLHSNNHSFLEGRSSEPASKVTSPNLSRLNSAEDSAARSKSVPTDEADPPQSTAFSVFQKAAAQMRAQHDESNPSSPSPEAAADANRTFFGDISASDDDDDDENDRRGYLGSAAGRFKPTELENIQEDPLGLNVRLTQHFDADCDQPVQSLRAPSSRADDPPKALGGLIHQHLRNTSNVSSAASVNQSAHHLRQTSDQSSIYATTIGRDDSVPNFNDHSKFGSRIYGGQNRMDNDYTHSNPWDLDELDDKSSNATSMFTQQSTTTSSQQDQRTLASVTSRAPTEVTSQRSSDISNWHPEHKREISSGTLEEREAFAMELAARQKAIQESMRAIVETDSRGSSPQQAQSATFKGFAILKHKASGDMSPKLDAQGNKAMKMLGLGAGGSSTSLSSMRKPSYASEENRLQERKPAAASAPGSARASPRLPSAQRTPPLADQKVRGLYDMQRPRMGSDMVRHGDGITARPSPPIGGPMPQPRSNSATSSAGMPYRGENASRSGSIRPKMSPKISQDSLPGSARGSAHNTPRQSPALVQKPMAPMEYTRPRGNSKSAGSSPTETRSPVPPPMPNGLRLTPSSSSPGPLSAAFKAAAASSQTGPRPAQLTFQSSPVVGPLSPNSNGPPTPSTIGSQTYVPTTKQFGGMLRKKTVQKSDISEPVLISSTSNVDTVDLPPGASLKKGMEMPIVINTPMNSRFKRTLKLFDFGKDSKEDTSELPAAHSPVDRYFNPGAPPPVPANELPPRKTSLEPHDDYGVQQSYGGAEHRPELRTMRSEESLPGSSFGMQSVAQRQLMAQAGMF